MLRPTRARLSDRQTRDVWKKKKRRKNRIHLKDKYSEPTSIAPAVYRIVNKFSDVLVDIDTSIMSWQRDFTVKNLILFVQSSVVIMFNFFKILTKFRLWGCRRCFSPVNHSCKLFFSQLSIYLFLYYYYYNTDCKFSFLKKKIHFNIILSFFKMGWFLFGVFIGFKVNIWKTLSH